jgi:serine/threonine protein kinase
VSVHEAGEIDGTCFIVYDFIEGATLRERLKLGWQPSWKESATLIRKLADALDHAHTNGVGGKSTTSRRPNLVCKKYKSRVRMEIGARC